MLVNTGNAAGCRLFTGWHVGQQRVGLVWARENALSVWHRNPTAGRELDEYSCSRPGLAELSVLHQSLLSGRAHSDTDCNHFRLLMLLGQKHQCGYVFD